MGKEKNLVFKREIIQRLMDLPKKKKWIRGVLVDGKTHLEFRLLCTTQSLSAGKILMALIKYSLTLKHDQVTRLVRKMLDNEKL